MFTGRDASKPTKLKKLVSIKKARPKTSSVPIGSTKRIVATFPMFGREEPLLLQLAPPPEPKPKPERSRVSHRQPALFGKLPEHGFVRLSTILEVFPVSRAAWWAGVKDGALPAGVLLSPRVRAWAVDDIRKLIADALNRPGFRGGQLV